MKKILLILVTVSSLIFTLTAATLASNVYIDGLIGGNEKKEGNISGITQSAKGDFSSLACGVNLECGRFLVNFEYAQNTAKAIVAGAEDSDTNTINAKCGFILSGDEQSYLALTTGYHQTKSDSSGPDQFSGALIGLGLVNNLTENSRLEGSLGYSVSGTCKFQDPNTNNDMEKDTDILLFQVKYSYYFTANIGLGIGYKLTQHKYPTQVNVPLLGMMDMDMEVTDSGPTVGVTYRF